MARLIEFFSRTGELVLDPFAGVGGTLLGAAIARGPRRAIGIELDPRWVAIYDDGRARPGRRARRARARARRPRHRRTRAGRAGSIRRGWSCGSAMRWRSCPTLDDGSVDFVATDPPYNVQLPLTMAGGAARRDARQPADRLRDGHRRTRPTSPTRPTTRRSSIAMETVFGELAPRPARPGATRSVIVRDAYQDGRYLFTGSDLAARADGGRARAQGRPHLVPGGDAAPAVRLSAGRSSRTSSTSTSWCCAREGPSRSGRGAATLEVGGRGRRCRRRRPSSRSRRRSASWPSASVGGPRPTTSPSVILWTQPWRPSGHRTSQ